MKLHSTVASAAILAVAAITGWLAGSGRLAWQNSLQAAPATPAREPALTACCNDAERGTQLAQAPPTATTLPLLVSQPTSGGKKPNILVIWGDDIGTWNISHNSKGMMGYM